MHWYRISYAASLPALPILFKELFLLAWVTTVYWWKSERRTRALCRWCLHTSTFPVFLTYPFMVGSLPYLRGDFASTSRFETSPHFPTLLYWHPWDWGFRYLTPIFLSLINDSTIPMSHRCASLDCFLSPLGLAKSVWTLSFFLSRQNSYCGHLTTLEIFLPPLSKQSQPVQARHSVFLSFVVHELGALMI